MQPEIIKQVKEKIAGEFINIGNTKTSIIETSHRSGTYSVYHKKASASLRTLLKIPEEFYVLWIHGEKQQQYEAICLNLLSPTKKCSYIITGPESEKAYELSKPHANSKIGFSHIDFVKGKMGRNSSEIEIGVCPIRNFDPNILIDNKTLIKYDTDDSFVFYVNCDSKTGSQFCGVPSGWITSICTTCV